jgi:hypothetical protein
MLSLLWFLLSKKLQPAPVMDVGTMLAAVTLRIVAKFQI